MQDPDARVLQRRRHVLEEHVGVPLDEVLGALGDQRELLAGGRPSAERTARPVVGRRFRPATRTM